MNRKMKTTRQILVFLALAIVLCLSSGCNKFKDIKVTGAKLESIRPAGLKSVHGTVLVGIDNPTMSFTIKDIEGKVRRKGSPFCSFAADGITVAKKCDDWYRMNGTVMLDPSVSVISILSLVNNFNPDDYTVDLSMRVKLKNGPAARINKKDIPARWFLKGFDLAPKKETQIEK